MLWTFFFLFVFSLLKYFLKETFKSLAIHQSATFENVLPLGRQNFTRALKQNKKKTEERDWGSRSELLVSRGWTKILETLQSRSALIDYLKWLQLTKRTFFRSSKGLHQIWYERRPVLKICQFSAIKMANDSKQIWSGSLKKCIASSLNDWKIAALRLE